MSDHTEMVFRAIEYIEQNLRYTICLDDIADAAYCSSYHFHRLFKQIVGDTPGNYIRKRRLTEAGRELKKTDKRILDIAIEHGFESQSAFSYAFRQYHKISPGFFRNGKSSMFIRKRITRQMLLNYRRVKMTEPKIISKETMIIVGVPYYGDGKDFGIEEIYVNLKKNIIAVKNRKDFGHIYGVCFRDPEFVERTGKFNYLVAVQVNDLHNIPLDMVGKTIPAHEYAVFRSKDASYDNIDPVVEEMWSYAQKWIYDNKVKQNRFFDFECYTEDEKGNLRYLEIYIPIIR
jgi:AraC family transcriptional regulator